MIKPFRFQILPIFILLLSGSHALLHAQSTLCPPPSALMAPDHPAYADAMNLQRTLEAQGFIVYCIYGTKLSSQFLVWENGISHSSIEGEACFLTNYGEFSVLFVPKPQSFADLRIKEHRKGGGYLYIFSGMPSVWTMKTWGSARKDFFLKQDNYILVSDAELNTRLEQSLRTQP